MAEAQRISDEDFIKGIKPMPKNPSLALAMRNIIADWCRMPQECLRPEQSTLELHKKMKAGWARGWDETGFLIKLEDVLKTDVDMQIRLPPFVSGRFLFWSFNAPENLGAWIGRAVQTISQKP